MIPPVVELNIRISDLVDLTVDFLTIFEGWIWRLWCTFLMVYGVHNLLIYGGFHPDSCTIHLRCPLENIIITQISDLSHLHL
jgi:hypothetical protein